MPTASVQAKDNSGECQVVSAYLPSLFSSLNIAPSCSSSSMQDRSNVKEQGKDEKMVGAEPHQPKKITSADKDDGDRVKATKLQQERPVKDVGERECDREATKKSKSIHKSPAKDTSDANPFLAIKLKPAKKPIDFHEGNPCLQSNRYQQMSSVSKDNKDEALTELQRIRQSLKKV